MILKELLKSKLAEDKLAKVAGGFEVVGDIAIVSIPPGLDAEKHLIAETLIAHRRDIRTVLVKKSKVSGFKRTAGFEIITGESTETTHSENGFKYRLDVGEVYFSTKLGYERARITGQVRKNEDVFIPFCGVGPFLIPVARKSRSVIGLERNKKACEYLEQNIALNKVKDNTRIVLADASSTNNLLDAFFDRIIIPTPYNYDSFLEIAVERVKTGGFIHFYTFKPEHELPGTIKWLEELGLSVEFYRKCGNIAPGVHRYVFDLKG